MGRFIRILIYLILGTLSWVLIFVRVNNISSQEEFIYNLKAKVAGPCSVPLYYSLGDVDSRFEISKEELKEAIKKAENVWEGASGRNLFEHKEDSEFEINLIFDERQLETIEKKKLEARLEKVENLQADINLEYDQLVAEYEKRVKKHEEEVEDYNSDLEDYQDNVEYWNDKGGAPEDEYEKLEKESDELEEIAQDLKDEWKDLNRLIKKINSLVKEGQEIVGGYNQEVETYKDRFGEAREFDQGLYVGDEINIYQFSDTADLELVLAHELGHYLGIEHLKNPESIMYYLMSEQDLENIHLTDEDLEAVEQICR